MKGTHHHQWMENWRSCPSCRHPYYRLLRHRPVPRRLRSRRHGSRSSALLRRQARRARRCHRSTRRWMNAYSAPPPERPEDDHLHLPMIFSDFVAAAEQCPLRPFSAHPPDEEPRGRLQVVRGVWAVSSDLSRTEHRDLGDQWCLIIRSTPSDQHCSQVRAATARKIEPSGRKPYPLE